MVLEIKIFNVVKYITINCTKTNAQKCKKIQRTAGKNNVVHHLSSVLTKTIFNIRARTTNFKMMYIRVVLYMCVRGVYKF